MSTVAFDTLKFAAKLEAGGFSASQAKAAAEAFAEATGQELATKTDLKLAVAELRADIIKWMVGLAMAQMALLIGILVKLL